MTYSRASSAPTFILDQISKYLDVGGELARLITFSQSHPYLFALSQNC